MPGDQQQNAHVILRQTLSCDPIDKSVPLGETDSTVIPYPPLWVIYHFITRDTISGGVFGKEQAISREEAIRAMTTGYAYLTFEENIKGSPKSGKLADLVVLSEDTICRC